MYPQRHKLTQAGAVLKDESQETEAFREEPLDKTGQDSGQRKSTQAPPKTTLPATTSQSPERMPAVAKNTAEIRKSIHPKR